MRTLIKFTFFLILLSSSQNLFAQAAWVDPEEPDVTKPVRLYVDLNKTTNTSCKENEGPFYIWTWKPVELGDDNPYVNGTGDKKWKNSNELLKMTKDDSKGDFVWYYEMTPTAFYGVPASEIYSKGISFLVKPKDGGGYGSPDIKTEDLTINISPPKLVRGVTYQFPAVILDNELTTIVYNNPADTVATMQNLEEGDAYLWIKCTAVDTLTGNLVTYQPSVFLKVGNNPSLEMIKDPITNMFSLTFMPRTFFGLKPSERGKEIECKVRRKVWKTIADNTTDQPKFKMGCK
jgi:hypothetical protein